MHYAVEDLCAGLACHWGVWVKPSAFWAIFPEVPPCGGKEPRMTCQFGQDCHCTSVWLTVLRKLIPLTLTLTLTLTELFSGFSLLARVLELMSSTLTLNLITTKTADRLKLFYALRDTSAPTIPFAGTIHADGPISHRRRCRQFRGRPMP